MVVFFKFWGSQQTMVDAADESDVYEDLNSFGDGLAQAGF